MEANKNNDGQAVLNSDDILNSVKEDTPLPQPQFTILLLVRFAEPVAFTFLFPFIYQMVKDLNVTEDEHQIAYYVGWIASSFAIAQFFTTLLWGVLSDRWGRKPCILLGLFGTGTSMLLFGLSKSLAWALVTRTMSGALNGNIAIAKSMAAELTDSTNRAKGFALFPVVFGIGSIFGPMIGGFLYNPAKNLSIMFGDNQFLKYYPSFLPCLVLTSLCYICLIFGWFYLEETLPSKRAKLVKYGVEDENNEADRLIDNHRNDSGSSIHSQVSSSSSTTMVQSNITTDQESLKSTELPVKKWNFNYTTKMTILGYTLLSLVNVMIDELFATWGPTPIHLGGVDFTTNDLAFIQSIAGVVIILSTQLIYTPIAKKYGVLKVFQSVFIPFFFVVLAFPLANPIAKAYGTNVAWYSTLLLYILRSSLGIFLFTSANILVSESAELHLLATVNAVAQTFGSLARATGPAVIGAVFSWSISTKHIFPFDYHFSWFLIGFVCIICAIASRLIKKFK